MTTESLQRATELQPLIEKAKENIIKWEKATSFKTNASIDALFSDGTTRYSCLYIAHVPFDIFRVISLDGYRKELQRLEDEFNSL